MWLIAGLGNPGDEYADSRHNAGFMVIDALSARFAIPLRQKSSDYIFGRGVMEDRKVILIKPVSFMKRSCIAVMDSIEPGVIKIKKSGSSGGHNGVQSVIDRLGSKDFVRIKVGIGRPARMPAERYVLRPFAKKERPLIEEAVETAADAIIDVLKKGITYAQNKYH